jgi:hypothetical protein
LRRVQSGRGAREIQFFRHRHEVPQMPQLHPDRLDGAAKNRNLETLAVSRGMSYEGGPRAGRSSRSGVVFLRVASELTAPARHAAPIPQRSTTEGSVK